MAKLSQQWKKEICNDFIHRTLFLFFVGSEKFVHIQDGKSICQQNKNNDFNTTKLDLLYDFTLSQILNMKYFNLSKNNEVYEKI